MLTLFIFSGSECNIGIKRFSSGKTIAVFTPEISPLTSNCDIIEDASFT